MKFLWPHPPGCVCDLREGGRKVNLCQTTSQIGDKTINQVIISVGSSFSKTLYFHQFCSAGFSGFSAIFFVRSDCALPL